MILSKPVNKNCQGFDIYIGRGSPWGNPWPITADHNRDDVCDRFEDFFMERIERDVTFRESTRQLRECRLGCFCMPKRCHGMTISAWVNHDYALEIVRKLGNNPEIIGTSGLRVMERSKTRHAEWSNLLKNDGSSLEKKVALLYWANLSSQLPWAGAWAPVIERLRILETNERTKSWLEKLSPIEQKVVREHDEALRLNDDFWSSINPDTNTNPSLQTDLHQRETPNGWVFLEPW